MAKEILAVPEDHLMDVIEVIRAGLGALGDSVDAVVEFNLTKWCNEMEEYVFRLSEEGE